MKLLNFSTGRIQTIQIGNETIRTAHIKAPVAEPWIITEDGAAGDQRAVHPDTLYAFARAGYAHWGAELGIDPAKWPDGFFGENLTIDDLDERNVRVGDVFAFGDTVRLVVTGARTPCVKLAWRLGQSRAFLSAFAGSRRTGAYFGVIEPGIVKPGDRLDRIAHDPAMPSIADVCDFVAMHDPPPLEPLRRLLAFDRLSPTLRLLLGAKLEAAEQAADAADDRWRGWRDFRIDRIVAETDDIRSVHLKPIDDAPLCRPRPGQHVSVRMEGVSGAPIQRSWSLSAFDRAPDGYRLTVRRQQGPGSNWIHDATPGALLKLKAPSGRFVLDTGSFRPLVLIAAGIGITPLYAMLQAHLARSNAAPVHLIYGARTPGHAAFREELEALAAAREDFRLTWAFSQSDAGAHPRGRITPRFVREALNGLYILLNGRRIDLPWYESDIYLCGPGDFCRSLHAELVATGANPAHLFLEQFQAPDAGEAEMESAEVRFVRSDRSATWDAATGETLLDLAERAGVAVESDCRAGSCLTCRTKVLAGNSTSDLGDGTALLCVGRPKTPRIELDC